MAKHAFHFRCYATDETENWTLPAPLKGATAFGVYLICEGERTHICSLEASSRADFIENDFTGADDPDAARAYLSDDPDNLSGENGGESVTYFGFIDTAAPANRPYLSRRYTVTLDSRDYDLDPDVYRDVMESGASWESRQAKRARAERRCLSDYAWEEARDYFSGNSPSIPVLLDHRALTAHRQRVAANRAAYEARAAAHA